MDEKFIYMYNHEEEERKIRNSIKKESFIEGKLEGGLEGNIDINIISKVTGLSLEEIKNINEA